VRKRHHHCENNELSELSVLRYKEQEVCAFVETLMIEAEARKSKSVVTSVSVSGATAYIASGEIGVPPSGLVS
jgi:hypothetical protein